MHHQGDKSPAVRLGQPRKSPAEPPARLMRARLTHQLKISHSNDIAMTEEKTNLQQVRDRLVKDLEKKEKEVEKLRAKVANLEVEIDELKEDIQSLSN